LDEGCVHLTVATRFLRNWLSQLRRKRVATVRWTQPSSSRSSSTPLNQLANTSSPNSARSRLLTRPQASPEDANCSCCATVLLLLHCSRSRRYAPHASHLSSQPNSTRTVVTILMSDLAH